jgi:membrane protease YdiL (CAAX protease family)
MSAPISARVPVPRRVLEFCAVFIGLPLLLAWQRDVMRHWIIPLLLVLASIFLIVLWRDPSFDRRQLYRLSFQRRACLTRILVILLLGGAATLAWALHSADLEPFRLPREQLTLWLLALLLYPLLSALSQEVIFRAFLFHRYRRLFADPRQMIAASALTFALAHLVLGNWVAPALALAGGLLFAFTYSRTHSLPLVALEHGLWGDWLFTIGYGHYLYGGHA